MAKLDECEDDETPLEDLMLNVVAIERGLLADLLAAKPSSVQGMVATVRYIDLITRHQLELGHSDDGWAETLLANLAESVRLQAAA